MKKYNSYKDSGIEWLGYKPEHWSNNRIDWITSFVRGNTGLKKDELLEVGEYVALQYGKTYKVDEVDNSFNFFVNSEYYKRNQTVKRGDTILISTSETIEDLGHSCYYNREEIGLLGGEQILLKPKTKLINEKYLYYFSKIFCSELRKYATGLKVFRFNTDDLKKVFIALPTPEEQTAITQYLDTKTQAIDKKINLLTKKAETYKELRKSIINDAVCKGLDKNVKLKESGIDWIGKIPEHWKISRVKDSFILFTGNSISDKGMFERKENSFDYVSTKDIDFETGQISYENGVYIPLEDKSFKIAKAYSTLICIEGANAGKKIGFTEKDICFVNKLCAIKSRTKNNADKYFFYYTQSPLFEKQFFAILNGLIGGVSLSSIKYFDIISPSKEEQTAIANYLDEKTHKIDTIVSNIGKQIDTLKELRKTLINDVVTGKIKVTANGNK